jgi:hypothetical protein
MERIVVQYKHVDASSEAHSYIWLIIAVAVVALFIPILWILVAVAALCVLPILYLEDKKQQKKFNDNIPALVVDEYILDYDGQTIDLSLMDKAMFHPDTDYDGNIMIYRKGKVRPAIEIYTDNMLIDRNELLKLIIDRINRAKELQQ